MDLEASQRSGFIERSCEGDPELRRTLESLVDHSIETGSAFDQALKDAVDPEGSIPTRLDLTGRILGHYRIVEKIGEGGMGEVYRATDTRLGRDVAIKILPEAFTRDPERLARFEREARVLASLNHPNIATIHGVEESEGTRFLVLELIEGTTLREALESGRMPLNTVIRLAAQVAAGLAKAHEAGVIHRDLKPENLMLTDDGFVKILDFGLAKAEVGTGEAIGGELKTATGRVMGTTSYMSPEQARGEALDHRSDQFSFGSVLFEMATGVRAFGGETDADTLVAIMRQEPERPEDFDDTVPPPLRSVIARCLEKDAQNRFETTRELARALRHLKALFWEIIESEMTGGGPVWTSRKRGPIFAAAFVVLLLMAVAVTWWRSQNSVEDMSASPGAATASIAVLPFEYLGSGDDDYFADGMTDALITRLSKIKALRVISRTSVMRYKNTEKPLLEIARELGVETVLTGSILHAGDRLRISTQLVESSTDTNIWADSYERDLGDILTLQSDVARAIANAVNVEVNPDEAARIATSRKIDPEAHAAYLRGMAEVDRRHHGGADLRKSLHAAFEHFERAIELEPEWAEAHSQLANAYRVYASFGGPDVQMEYYPKAKATALRALEIDNTVARAYLTLGYVSLHHEWNWTAAEQSILRALEIDPNQSAWAYARYLTFAGRLDEALEYYEKAQRRNPTSTVISRQIGWAYLCAGRFEEAEALAKLMIEAFPDSNHGYGLLGSTYLRTSRYDEAVALLERGKDLEVAYMPGLAAQMLPVALARAGRTDEARVMLHELEASGLTWFPELYWVLGEEAKAMAQIEAAFAVHRDILMGLRCECEYGDFAENPRFREIVEAIGFPNVTYLTPTRKAPS